MRIARRNVALAIVLAGLVAVWIGGRESAPPSREIVPLFPSFAPAEVASLEVSQGDRRLRVARADGGYVLPDLFGYPADARVVERWLERLATLSTLDLLTDDAARHAEYGLDEASAKRVAVFGASGEQVADLFVGRGSAGNAFVRAVGEPAVYGAGALPDPPLEPERWRRAEALVAADELLVLRAVLRGPALSADPESAGDAEPVLELVRDTNRFDVWRDASGRALPADVAMRLVREVLRVYPEKVVAGEPAPEHGLDPARLHVALELADGSTREIDFGASDPTSAPPSVHAAAGDGPWVVTVGASVLERVVSLARSLLAE